MNDSHNTLFRYQKIAIVFILLLSAICIAIWSGEGDSGFFHKIQSKVSSTLSPLSINFNGGSSENQNSKQDESSSSESYSALKSQNDELTAQLAKAEEYRQEAKRLQDLLKIKDTYNIDGITARVIGRTTDNWNQTVTLNVGEGAGAFVGATVCTADGVVGQVVSVNDTTCTVRLINDPKSGIAAMVQSNRSTCVVKGSLDGLITAENFDLQASVKAGDIIITSGLGGSFTKGIIIGTVSKVSGTAQDGTLKAVLKQNETSRFEEAIIVKSAQASSD